MKMQSDWVGDGLRAPERKPKPVARGLQVREAGVPRWGAVAGMGRAQSGMEAGERAGRTFWLVGWGKAALRENWVFGWYSWVGCCIIV